jgi:hypothetical protein
MGHPLWAINYFGQHGGKKHKSLTAIMELVYNGGALKIEANRQSRTSQPLINVASATEDDIVQALADTGNTLSSIYHTVGTISISQDAYFHSVKHKINLAKWEEKNGKM